MNAERRKVYWRHICLIKLTIYNISSFESPYFSLGAVMHTFDSIPLLLFTARFPQQRIRFQDICNKEVNFFFFSINTLATTSTQVQDHETKKEEMKDHLQAHKWKSLRCVRLFVTPRTVAHQAPLSVGFSRQEYWSGLQCPSLRGSSQPRGQTQDTSWATREAPSLSIDFYL